jgi:hypothetical protein
VHTPGATHGDPHFPQLAGSVFVSLQPVGQHVSPGEHAGPVPQSAIAVQTLDTHVSPTGHTLPHAPQLFGSVFVSMQPDAQHWSGGVHAGPALHPIGARQKLSTHVLSGGHGMPQPPQLVGSVVVSLQPVVQHASVPLQAGPPLHAVVDMHLPPAHLSPDAHGIPQPPQLFGSVLVLLHPSLQQASMPVQAGPPLHPIIDWHLLSTQVSVAAHAWPQLPQSLGSLVVSLHPSMQHASEPLQGGPPLHVVVDWHLLATQVSPGGQGIPQPPQSLLLLVVSSHPSLQQAREPVQAGPPLHVVVDWHLLATHLSPVGQGIPQPPQFSGSLFVSVHPTEQQVSPPVQAGSPWQLLPGTQRLSTQDSPGAHGWPQLPQFLGSLEVSAQPVAQHWAGAVQAGTPLHSTGE